MINLTHDTLLEHLKERGLEPQLQESTSQIYFPYKSTKQEFTVFLRIYEGGQQLQIMTFFPHPIRPGRFDVMGRVLHLLNKEIDCPGFGLDESTGLSFHRVMLPAEENRVSQKLLNVYLDAIPSLCEQFYPAIFMAATSGLTFEALTRKPAS